MKTNIKLLLIFITVYNTLSIVSTNSDCGTPVECYTKSINTLNQARDEYRANSEKFQQQIQEISNSYNAKLIEVKTQSEQNTIAKVNEARAKLEQDNTNLRNELVNLINVLRAEKNDLQNQVNGIMKSGGSYQVDDCGTNNIANPRTGGLNCPGGYNAHLVGRIKCPEGRNCGGNQYECLK